MAGLALHGPIPTHNTKFSLLTRRAWHPRRTAWTLGFAVAMAAIAYLLVRLFLNIDVDPDGSQTVIDLVNTVAAIAAGVLGGIAAAKFDRLRRGPWRRLVEPTVLFSAWSCIVCTAVAALMLGTYKPRAQEALQNYNFGLSWYYSFEQLPRRAPEQRPAPIVERDGMVLIPAGDFTYGSTEHETKMFTKYCAWPPQRGTGCELANFDDEINSANPRVYLSEFWIDKYPVTNEQFQKFVDATGYQTLDEQRGFGFVWNDYFHRFDRADGISWRTPLVAEKPAIPDMAVVQLTWDDANRYCQWAAKRLPTEAEWEKAARGTDGRIYPWGFSMTSQDLLPVANHYLMKPRGPQPVGRFPAGASPYGAEDMVGTVFQWVSDWYDPNYYQVMPARDPQGPSTGNTKVQRGASWGTHPSWIHVAWRQDYAPGVAGPFGGVRCAFSQ